MKFSNFLHFNGRVCSSSTLSSTTLSFLEQKQTLFLDQLGWSHFDDILWTCLRIGQRQINGIRWKSRNLFSLRIWHHAEHPTMGLCKINSWDWTLFSFFLHMMTWWSVLVIVPTVFDKTQARAKKSIFCVKSNKNVALNHLEYLWNKYN